MNQTKEIILGIFWGVLAGLALSFMLYSVGRPAEEGENGTVEITISSDSLRLVLEKDGDIRTMTVARDAIVKSDSAIKVEDEVIIEHGKIYIGGMELTEKELRKLVVDKEEVKLGISIGRDESDGKVIKRRRLATVYTDTMEDLVGFGDVVVEKDVRISGDVVSVAGDVTVYGEVDGDVVSVFGDVILKEGASVGKDVAAPFGAISRDEGVVVSGDEIAVSGFKKKKHEGGFGMGARFDRVEGFTLVPSLRYRSDEREFPAVELEAAYAFTLKRWEYNVKVSNKLGGDWGPFFHGSMYRLAETSDRWIMPMEEENTLAGLLLKEDFYDFYWMRGFSAGGGVWHGEDLELGATFTGAQIEALARTAEKAIFGGKKKFRENWSTILPDSAAIVGIEGELNEVVLNATYDTRDDVLDTQSGILANIDYSQTVSSGDFDYSKVDLELKGYFPTTSSQTLFVRIRGGYSDDDLPLFRRYFIGGIGSLRGYDYKEFEGNRCLLFNSDYVWQFFEMDLGAGVFFDAGKAAFSGRQLESGELKAGAGIAFIVSDLVRIDLAQRLDDFGRSPVLTARADILF